MNTHLRNIFGGVTTQVLAQTFSSLNSVLSVPLLLTAVGQETYGLYLLLLSVTGFYGLAQFGFTSSLRNAVAFHHGQGDHQRANQVLNGCLTLFGIIFGVLFLLITALLLIEETPLKLVLKQEPGKVADARTIMLFLSFFQLFNVFVSSSLNNLYGGLRRLVRLNVIDCVLTILSTPVYLGFLFLKPGILSVISFMTVQSLVRAIVLYTQLKKEFSWLKIRMSPSNLKYISEINTSSMHFTVTSILAALVNTTDSILVSRYFGTASVFTYSILFKLFKETANPFPIANNAWSEVSHVFASGNREQLHKLYSQILRLNVLIKVPLFILVATFAGEVISTWIGAQYFAGYALTYVFAATWSLNVWSGSNVLFVNATGNQARLIAPFAAEAILNLAASIIFANHLGLGPLGIALGTLVAQITVAFYFVPRIVAKEFNFPVYKNGLKILLPVFVLGVAFAALKHLAFRRLESPYAQSTVSLVIAFAYAAALWLFVLTRSEKQQLGKLFQAVSGRLRKSELKTVP